MKDNIARLVLSSLLRQSTKPAIGDTHHLLTRASLLANVAAQAQTLRKEGLGAGDFCIVLCDRGLPFWTEVLAAWVIGAKPVCVERKVADEHAASILQLTGVRYIVGFHEETSQLLAGLKRLSSTFDPQLHANDVQACYAALPFASDAELPDMAGLLFTSGTTGLPKGVPLVHRALILNALASAQRLRLKPTDRLFIATPFRFISSISHFLVTLISGAAFFGLEQTLMIKDLLQVLNKLSITAFGGSPFHVQFIAMAGRDRLPKLRWIMSSGDHLRPAVIDQLRKAFDGIELHVVYGMTELAGRFCELPPEYLDSKPGSVGYPVNGFELRLLDDEGNPCKPGEIGNVHVDGLISFDGYYKNEKANAQVITAQGFATGDKGYLDDDGFLYLAGRSDSVFKRSGLKVSAQVIIDALMSLDGVRDVYVRSEDDPIEGQVPVAYVCWQEGKALEAAAALKALRERLPVNHLPKRFVALPAIPRTGSGKVDRRKIAELIASVEGH